MLSFWILYFQVVEVTSDKVYFESCVIFCHACQYADHSAVTDNVKLLLYTAGNYLSPIKASRII